MKLGRRIKELRESKGLSLRQAAPQLGVSFGMLGKVEAGLAFPGEELFNMLSAFFEVPLLELRALEAVDRGRISVPTGADPEAVMAAVYRLAGEAAKAKKTQQRAASAFSCPHCGKLNSSRTMLNRRAANALR